MQCRRNAIWPFVCLAAVSTAAKHAIAWVYRPAGPQIGNGITITTLLTTVMQRPVGRARPFLRECATNPNADPNCAGSANSRNSSFISGHASLAFAGATTLCVQHSRLSLYGSADPFVCPAALGIAAGSSLLRVVADRHWMTDVIGGAVVGATVGAVVPAVHLRESGSAPQGVLVGEEGRSMICWRRF